MSRSKRKTPKAGITTAKSEKEDKRFNNRRERKKVRQILHCDPEVELLPHRDEISSIWSMAKDGKRYLGRNADPKWLRK
jgi:hypothetical protein